MKRIFLSIPTSEDPRRNREKADLLKGMLSRKGWDVVSPYEIYFGRNPTREDIIATRLRAMLDCDAVFICQFNSSLECDIEEKAACAARRYATTRIEDIIYENKYDRQE